jgi:hypothetical protein
MQNWRENLAAKLGAFLLLQEAQRLIPRTKSARYCPSGSPCSASEGAAYCSERKSPAELEYEADLARWTCRRLTWR